MKYLPDKPASAGRAFVFNVINTIDPNYFRKALNEIEHIQLSKNKKSREEFIEITPEMETLLTKYMGFTGLKPTNWRGLAGLKVGAKKRQRTERNVSYDLKTSIKKFAA